MGRRHGETIHHDVWAREEQNDLAATTRPGIDLYMDLTRGCEGKRSITTQLNGAVTEQVEQTSHVGLELLRVHQSAGGDAVKHRATAAEQAAQRTPKLDPG